MRSAFKRARARRRDGARVDVYEGVGDVNTGGRRRKKSSGRVRSGSVWVRRKKRLRCYPRGVAAQPRIPKNRRSDPRGVGSLACTRTDCLFYIPKRVPAVAHPRSARTHFRKSLASEDAVPFGFCSGGFSSTSSLRSGQRGSTEVERRSLPTRLIISSRAPSRFYPRGSDESADSSCASLSASAGASVAATFTAGCCPQAARCRVARRSPCRSRLP